MAWDDPACRRRAATSPEQPRFLRPTVYCGPVPYIPAPVCACPFCACPFWVAPCRRSALCWPGPTLAPGPGCPNPYCCLCVGLLLRLPVLAGAE